MNKTEFVVFCVIVLAALLGGFAIELKSENVSLKRQAVALNYAEYNSTNGNWQWKTNSIK